MKLTKKAIEQIENEYINIKKSKGVRFRLIHISATEDAKIAINDTAVCELGELDDLISYLTEFHTAIKNITGIY